MTNKLLLAAIALGLFANAAATLVRPARADAGGCQSLGGVQRALDEIADSVRSIESHLFYQATPTPPKP